MEAIRYRDLRELLEVTGHLHRNTMLSREEVFLLAWVLPLETTRNQLSLQSLTIIINRKKHKKLIKRSCKSKEKIMHRPTSRQRRLRRKGPRGLKMKRRILLLSKR